MRFKENYFNAAEEGKMTVRLQVRLEYKELIGK